MEHIILSSWILIGSLLRNARGASGAIVMPLTKPMSSANARGGILSTSGNVIDVIYIVKYESGTPSDNLQLLISFLNLKIICAF